MADLVGNIVVGMQADVAQFQSDLGRAARVADQKGQDIKSALLAGVAGLGGALAGVASTVKSAMDTFLDTADFAKRIQGTVQEVLALDFAAAQVLISADQMRDSMKELQLRASEAALGTGEAKDAFELLNINLEKFTSIGISDQFRVLAEGLSRVENEQQKVFIADSLFGDQGFEMLKLLGEGQGAIQAFTEQAEALGFVIGEQNVADARALKAEINQLKNSFDAFSRAIGAAVLPKINDLIAGFKSLFLVVRQFNFKILDRLFGGEAEIQKSNKAFSDLTAKLRLYQDQLTKAKAGGRTELIPGIQADIRSVNRDLDALIEKRDRIERPAAAKTSVSFEQFTGFEGKRSFVSEAEKAASKSREQAIRETANQRDRITEMVSALQAQAQQLGYTSSQMELYRLSAAGASPAQLQLAKAALDSIDAFAAQEKAANQADQTLRVVGDTLIRYRAATSGVTSDQLEFNRLLHDLDILLEEQPSRIGEITRAMEDLSRAHTEYIEKQEENEKLKEFWESVEFSVQRWSNTFADALLRGEFSFKSFIRTVLAELARAAVVRGVTGIIGTIFGKEGLLSNVVGALAGSRQFGGSVRAGQSYLVGERGPEVFTPGTSGRVSPGTGGGVQVNVYANESARTERRQGIDGQEQIDIYVGNAVSRKISEGQFDSAFANRFGLGRKPVAR